MTAELRRIDLGPFFAPRTVAVIGASDTPHKPNTAMWQKLRKKVESVGATVYPVNPNRDEVDGLTCYRSVGDVPGELDLAVILVGDALPAMREVIAKKAKFAVVFAADFAESGAEGAERQQELEEMVAASETRLLGPNTNMNAFEFYRDDLPGKAIALITQSGHQGRPVFQGQEIGIRLSQWAPTGNEVDLEFADFAAYFADQPEVGAIATYVEGFKDGLTLRLALDHCAQAGKPVVAVKVGRTDEGASMAQAHTGHLTGADAVVDAVFRQYGVTRVDGLDELLDVAAAFARTTEPSGTGVVIYSISGGTGAHMADLASTSGLDLVTLSEETQARLREHIPGYLRVSNPVDSGGGPSGDKRGALILDAILEDPGVAALICPITGAASMGNRLAKDLTVAAAKHGKPVFVVWGSPVGNEVAYTDILLPSGIPVFRTFANCVTAVRAYFDYAAFRSRFTSPFAAAAPPSRRDEIQSLLRPGTLSERDSKAVLSAYGVPVSRDVLVATGAEAAKAAGELGGRVVLKVSSAEIAHKSDLGLVRVGVAAEDAEAVADELLATAARLAPTAQVDGVLVCEMVTGGVEVVVGIARDPLFGPVVMVGLGGVLVEVLGDVTHRVPPFDLEEAGRMLDELKGVALLHGVRGRPGVAIEALLDAIMAVQHLATDLADDVAEVDINPLLVTADRAVALDALIVCRDASREAVGP